VSSLAKEVHKHTNLHEKHNDFHITSLSTLLFVNRNVLFYHCISARRSVWPGKKIFCEKVVARPAGNAVVTCYSVSLSITNNPIICSPITHYRKFAAK